MRCPSIPALATFVVFAFNLPNTKAQTINAYDDLNEALNLINQARGAQGIQPLAWNTDLVTYAHVWASQMATGQVGFEHASGAYRPEQGENLYEETASSCDATSSTPLVKAVQDWLAQAALYDGQPITTGHEHWLHWCKHFPIISETNAGFSRVLIDVLQLSVCGMIQQ